MSIRLIVLFCGAVASTLMFYVMLATTRAMLRLPRRADRAFAVVPFLIAVAFAVVTFVYVQEMTR